MEKKRKGEGRTEELIFFLLWGPKSQTHRASRWENSMVVAERSIVKIMGFNFSTIGFAKTWNTITPSERQALSTLCGCVKSITFPRELVDDSYKLFILKILWPRKLIFTNLSYGNNKASQVFMQKGIYNTIVNHKQKRKTM